MRLEIVATTAIVFAIALAAPTKANSSASLAQLLENKQCQKCNSLGADVKDVQQQRQQQRQQRQEAWQQRIQQQQQQLQQLPPVIRQQRQEQQQQRQEQRQELRQQRLQLRQQLPPEVRQERIEQWQQLPPEVRQQRQEQRQQRQEFRQERRDDRQDARQERRDYRQDVRQDIRQDRLDNWQDAWQDHRYDWHRDAWLHQNWWYYEPGQTLYVNPVPTYVAPTRGVNSIRVDLMSLTNERAIVLIENADARQELIFTGNRTRQTVYLAPGVHKLWFKNAKGSPWISGSLNLGKTDRIRIAFNQNKKLVQVYDDPYAWIEDRRSSRRTQVRQTPVVYPKIANEEVDSSICYMQTQDGRTLNLHSICNNPTQD
jgi:hypothetical protein